MLSREKQIKTHEVKTWDKRAWAITEPEFKYMKERMEAGAKFLTVPDGSDSTIAVSDVKFIGRRQMTMSDMYDETKALPAGKPKEFDPTSKGYIKFLAMSIKLRRKNGTSIQQVLDKITDEQRPLINEELEKAGVEFRV
jgi:hypothetical protein